MAPTRRRRVAGADTRFEPAHDPAPVSDSASRTVDRDVVLDDPRATLHTSLARESEERFRQIADALHDVVALSDAANTNVLFVNAAYEEIWHRPSAELYANPLAMLEGVHPDDRERVRHALTAPSPEEHDLEFRVVRPDGTLRWVWRRSVPVRGPGGEIYRMASITEDITERKYVIESHQRLIRGFTHDVKNPLGAANGFLSLLADGVFGDLTAQQAEIVGRIRHSIHGALDLVSHLLELERAEAGQLSVRWQRVDLGGVCRDLVDEFRGAATARDLALNVPDCGEEDAIVIDSDPALVHQILANLVSNATKYTQAGGAVTIRVLPAEEDQAPAPGSWVTISVADNGPGIPFEKQNLLFREFTRFQPDAVDGTGIGLAISQRLARALGGAIRFRSTPGGGSTFTLWLPNNPPPATAS